jgi:DNA mismatch endonuclease (patch repair protein)
MAPDPTSWASSAAVRKSMQGNKRRDTAPELQIRRLVHAMGLRYRVDARPLADFNRRADLVFRGPRIAVFVDGCFWHGCPAHGTKPKTNGEYWSPKIARNKERDAETTDVLIDAGWRVIRTWEHEDPVESAERIAAAVRESS